MRDRTREKEWRKAQRVTVAFELSRGKDDDILAYMANVPGMKVDWFRKLVRWLIESEARNEL